MLTHKITTGILLVPFIFILIGGVEVDAQEDFSGAVFKDVNLNGVRDEGESGIEGIVVSLYNDAGLIASTISGADGFYSLQGEAGEAFRLQIQDYENFGYQPSIDSGNLSSVRFLTSENSNSQNFGLHVPSEFCGSNPDIVISCFVTGKQVDDGRLISDPALVDIYGDAGYSGTVPDKETVEQYSNPKQHDLMIPASSIGTTYGIAYDPTSDTVFAASFMKRHSGFGPGGTGAIYQINRSSGTASVFTSLEAGIDPHPTTQFENENNLCEVPGRDSYDPAATEDCWLHDPYSFNQVGFVGLGDLEINEDLSILYTINLADKSLYALDPVSGDVVSVVPVPGDCVSDFVPFGIGIHKGIVYAGVSCTDASTAQVYAFDESTGIFDPAPVLRFGLSYERGNTANWFVPPMSANWNPWISNWSEVDTQLAQGEDTNVTVATKAQAVVSDIEFDNSGNMLIGLRDRFGDQTGHAFSTDTNDSTIYEAEAAGDLLKACVQGESWIIEGSSDTCPTNTGLDNIAEFFTGDSYIDGQGRVTHGELSLGSLAYDSTIDQVISSTYNPIPFYYSDGETDTYRDQGLRWYNAHTGFRERSYRLIDGNRSFDYFDKANGLGDLEFICDSAPIEIGNRVWFDSDRDGNQDPSEPTLSGVEIELIDNNGTLVATATTDANGYYLFSSGDGESNDHAQYDVNLAYRGTYVVRINTTQSSINGYAPTLTSNGSSNIDSDGLPVGSFVEAEIVTGSSGHNNHDIDFGFVTGSFGSSGPEDIDFSNPSEEGLICDDIYARINQENQDNYPCFSFGGSSLNSNENSTSEEVLIRTGGK